MGAGASTAVAEPTYRDASHMSVPTFEETRDHVLRSMEVERAAASPPGVHVVIDGMNVALGNVPSYETDASAIRAAELRGLQLAVEYWATAGVGFKIFAPRGWIDDHPEVAELQRASLLFATPGGRDDHFLIQHADVHGSFVVSNDRFLDHVRDRGYDGRWLDYHRAPLFGARDGTCLALVSEVAAAAAPGALTTPVGDDAERLVVPRQAVGRVIGKRGATIQGIERNSGARVRVDDGGDRSSDIAGILIAGAPDQRAQAVEAITDIVSRSRYPPPRKDAMDLC
ncbi:Zc3h12a-like ribonuclease NYN domain containing protein [Aureococcus anophagefferens]|nr:Zc3h12a-like ribonuclease NYN domain containing protein [Aureococcus anophagefferens]